MSESTKKKGFGNECRLCLSKTELLWLFDESLKNDLQEIVEVTCGVKILNDDPITQMVCKTCWEITQKMYKFRAKAIKNDSDLKAKHTAAHIQTLKSIKLKRNVILPKYKNAHPSIKKILMKYPNIKLPETPLNSHMDPYITLVKDEVEDYFKERCYTTSEFNEMKTDVLLRHFTKKQDNHPNSKKRTPDIPSRSSEPFSKKIKLHSEVVIKPLTSSSGETISDRKSRQDSEHEQEGIPKLKITWKSKSKDEDKDEGRRSRQRKNARPFSYNEELLFLASAATSTDSEQFITTDNATKKNQVSTPYTTMVDEANNSCAEQVQVLVPLPNAQSDTLHHEEPLLSDDSQLLVSQNKATRLYTCRLCNSHYYTFKDLKIHERRNHTKCPFCSKRFKSISSRDEHMKTECDFNLDAAIAASSFKRVMKLQLVKVDEDPEIREKYPNAFNTDNYTSTSETESAITDVTTISNLNGPESEPSETQSLLQKCLQSAGIIEGCSNESKNEVKRAVTPAEVLQVSNVICISDDESEPNNPKPKASNPALQKQLFKIVRQSNFKPRKETDEIQQIKEILMGPTCDNSFVNLDAIKNSNIVGGESAKSRRFKNLRKYLYKYHIPVEIKFSSSLDVQYNEVTPPPRRYTHKNLWSTLPIKKIVSHKTHSNQVSSKKQVYTVNIPAKELSNAKANALNGNKPNHTTGAPIVLNGHIMKPSPVRTTMSEIQQNSLFMQPVATNAEKPQTVSASSNSKTATVENFTVLSTAIAGVPIMLNGCQNPTNTSPGITNLILLSTSYVPTKENPQPSAVFQVPQVSVTVPQLNVTSISSKTTAATTVLSENTAVTTVSTVTDSYSSTQTCTTTAKPTIRVKTISELC